MTEQSQYHPTQQLVEQPLEFQQTDDVLQYTADAGANADSTDSRLTSGERSTRNEVVDELGDIAVAKIVRCPVAHGGSEQVPPRKRTTGEHNKRFKPVQDELATVVGSMNTTLAATMRDRLIAEDGSPVTAWSETAIGSAALTLPYGAFGNLQADPYRALPTTFFNGVNGETQDPVIPRTWYGRNKLIKQHEQRLAGIKEAREGTIGTQHVALTDKYDAQYRTSGQLRRSLKAMRRHGVTIDPEQWQQHTDLAERTAPRPENVTALRIAPDVEKVLAGRNFNSQSLIENPTTQKLLKTVAAGRFKNYLYQSDIDAERFSFSGNADAMILPIGEYGPDLSEQILHTVQYTMSLAEGMKTRAEELARDNSETLSTYTARGRDAKEGALRPASGLIDATQEGIASAGYVMALLTAEKIEGYDDPLTLLNDIQEAGLITKFTAAVPMGITGPFVMAGAYFPDLVQKHNGSLRLNPNTMAALKEVRNSQVKHAIGEWATRDYRIYKQGALQTQGEEEMGINRRTGSMGMICPAARRNGGLTELSDAMIETITSNRSE